MWATLLVSIRVKAGSGTGMGCPTATVRGTVSLLAAKTPRWVP